MGPFAAPSALGPHGARPASALRDAGGRAPGWRHAARGPRGRQLCGLGTGRKDPRRRTHRERREPGRVSDRDRTLSRSGLAQRRSRFASRRPRAVHRRRRVPPCLRPRGCQSGNRSHGPQRRVVDALERDLVRRGRSRRDPDPGLEAARAGSPRRTACGRFRHLRHLRERPGAARQGRRECRGLPECLGRSARPESVEFRPLDARVRFRLGRRSGFRRDGHGRRPPAAGVVPAPQRRLTAETAGRFRRRSAVARRQARPGRARREPRARADRSGAVGADSRARTAVLRCVRLFSGRQADLFRGGGASSPQARLGAGPRDRQTARPDAGRGPAADAFGRGSVSVRRG